MKIKKADFYPASQFHFMLTDRMSDELNKKIDEAIKQPMSGLVSINWVGLMSIIITTAHGPEERKEWENKFLRWIESVL